MDYSKDKSKEEHISPGYSFFSTTADGGFTAWANSKEELFIQAGIALFSFMTDIELVRQKENFTFQIQAESIEDLMIDWLNELIYISDFHNVFLSRFAIVALDTKNLHARVSGEKINANRHLLDKEVKAVTYHDFQLKINDCCFVKVIVDL